MEDYFRKPQMIAHIEKSLDFSIFDTKWIPCSAKFVVLGCRSNGNGILRVYELNDGQLKCVAEREQQRQAFKCGSFGASSLRRTHMAVGDFEGKLQIFDLDHMTAAPLFSVANAHTGIINCLDAVGGNLVNCGAPEIVTGGRDGAVRIWDPRQTEAVACMHGSGVGVGAAHSMADPLAAGDAAPSAAVGRDCWAVAFGGAYDAEERCVCAGYDNGDVKLFDLRVMRERWSTNTRNGICGIEFDRRNVRLNKLTVTTLEGGLLVYDLRTQHPELGMASVVERDAGRSLGTNGVIAGAKSTVWCARHLPQNRDVFVTCGGSGSVRLWKYEYPEKRIKEASDGHKQGVAGTLQMLQATTISSQPVNCFDWSPDRIGLAVCGAFDQTVRVLVTTKLNSL